MTGVEVHEVARHDREADLLLEKVIVEPYTGAEADPVVRHVVHVDLRQLRRALLEVADANPHE